MIIGIVLFVICIVLISFVVIYDLTHKEEPKKENISNQTIFEKQAIDKFEQKKDTFDDLYKYKELLDMGAITQEEFEAKKKELL